MRFRFWGPPVASLLALGVFGCEQSSPSADAPAPSNGGAPPVVVPQACEAPVPGPAPLRPLTRFHYNNIVRDLLGDTSAPAQALPPENEVEGYRSMANANRATPLLIEGYLATAESVAAKAAQARLATVAPCAEGQDPVACGHAFVTSFSARAFRRPLTKAELAPLVGLFDLGHATSYARGVELVIQAVLQSPQFLYRVESLRAATPESGAIALSGYELASRLAFSLWGSVPDEALMTAAGEGRLVTPADVEREARRMLEDQRARDIVRDFSEQWLFLSRLDGAARVGTELAPKTLSNSLKTSLTRFLEDTYLGSGATFEKLMLDPSVWLDVNLAPIYGGTAPSADFAAQALPEPRFGLLTQPGLLAELSHSDQTAPVIRGVFVRERILCLPVASPPPNLNAVAPDPDPNATTRERFRQHTEQEACSGCHQLIDGVGFGFERYDQLGRYRPVENGFDVDESGQVLASGEPALDGAFAGVGELAERIAKSSRARDCLASNWFTYTFGRETDPTDQCSLNQLKERFANSGGDLKELLVALTQTDSFLYRPAMEAP